MKKQNKSADKQNLLHKYLQGKISTQEEQALKKYAINDPFIADAMRGYQEFKGDPNPHLDQIRSRLGLSSRNRKRGWLSLAAILIPIGLISIAIWLLKINSASEFKMANLPDNMSPSDSFLALSKTENNTLDYQSPSVETEINDYPLQSSSERKSDKIRPNILPEENYQPINNKPDLEAATSKNRPVNNQYKLAKRLKPNTDKLGNYQPDGQIQETDTSSENLLGSADSVNNSDGILSRNNVPDKITLADFDIPAEEITPEPSAWKGITTDFLNQPLKGVYISWTGRDTATVSTLNGTFHLPLVTLPATVEISHADYITQIFQVEHVSDLPRNITLQSATEFAEVEQVESEKKKINVAQEMSLSSTAIASPTPSLKAFQKYIKKNQKVPDAAKTANISGIVAVSFLVKPDGSLTNFRITKSLGYGCDEEAIRLLKDGPRWKLSPPMENGIETAFEIQFDAK